MKRYEMNGREACYCVIDLKLPNLIIDLYHPIDQKAMQEALCEALRIHPFFRTRLCFQDRLFHLEENPQTPILFSADNAPEVYGTTVNNDFPWIAVTDKNRLILSAPHMLTDGAGYLRFCRTILCHYFHKTGIVVSDLPQGTPRESTEDAIAKYAKATDTPQDLPASEQPCLLDKKLLQPCSHKIWRLTLSDSEVHELRNRSETSVSAVISCILARAMADAYQIQKGNICLRLPIDYRAILPSETDRNFAFGASLYYNAEEMNCLPNEQVEKALRRQLKSHLEPEKMTAVLQKEVDRLQRFHSNPEQEERTVLEIARPSEPRADIVYSHIKRPGFSEELGKQILDIRLDYPDYAEGIIFVLAITFKDEIRITIHQCSKNDSYIDSLRRILEERKLTYSLVQYQAEKEYRLQSSKELKNK